MDLIFGWKYTNNITNITTQLLALPFLLYVLKPIVIQTKRLHSCEEYLNKVENLKKNPFLCYLWCSVKHDSLSWMISSICFLMEPIVSEKITAISISGDSPSNVIEKKWNRVCFCFYTRCVSISDIRRNFALLQSLSVSQRVIINLLLGFCVTVFYDIPKSRNLSK